MEFDNYIFDLYGTLIDIHTDEQAPELWTAVCDYLAQEFLGGQNLHAGNNNIDTKALRKLILSPKELKDLYFKLDKQERKALPERLGTTRPEIRIEWVWERILAGEGKNAKTFDQSCPRAEYVPLPIYNFEEKDEALIPSHLLNLCRFFRRTSRDVFRPYPDTIKMLQTLKSRGKKIFLLSNAQRTFTREEILESGIAEYFDDIFMSSDKLIMKPDTGYMKLLLDKHNLDKAKCVMIGNEIGSDIKIADDFGMESILVTNGDFSKIL